MNGHFDIPTSQLPHLAPDNSRTGTSKAMSQVNTTQSQLKSPRHPVSPLFALCFPSPPPGSQNRRRQGTSIPVDTLAASQSVRRSQSRASTPAPAAVPNAVPPAAPLAIEYCEEKGTINGFEYHVKHLGACPIVVNLGQGWQEMKRWICGHNAGERNNNALHIRDILDHVEQVHPDVFMLWEIESALC